MKKSITQRIYDGEKIYPYMNGKLIGIARVIDLTEQYKDIIKQPEISCELEKNNYKEINNFKEFKRLLLEDNSFLNIIKKYFNNIGKLLISDKNGEKIFEINLKESEEKPYTLKLVQLYCEMNRENFFNNYIDAFGNEITFE